MKRWAVADAAQYIQSRARFGIKPGLNRISALLRELGDPQSALRFVHIAGTNGKGSTSAMLANVLRCAGYRTGLYTSPSLHSLTERICVDGAPIGEDDFADVVLRVKHAAMSVRGDDQATEFELLTAAALLHFVRADVDLVVLETGLGGRYDATNIVHPELAVITNVDYDHTDILGARLEMIAFDKAGIIKENVPVLSGATGSAARVVERVARQVGAPLLLCGEDLRAVSVGVRGFDGQRVTYFGMDRDLPDIPLRLSGRHQVRNAALALGAVEILRRRGFDLSASAVRDGLRSVAWPGRMEIVQGTPTVVLDGAHNRAGAQALADALRELGIYRAAFVIGIFADKDIPGMLRSLAPLMKSVVAVAAGGPRAAPPEMVADACRRFSGPSVTISAAGSIEEGIAIGLEQAVYTDALVVTGSLSTVAMARQWLGLAGAPLR